MKLYIFVFASFGTSAFLLLPTVQATPAPKKASKGKQQEGWVRAGAAEFFGYNNSYDHTDADRISYKTWSIASTTGDHIANAGNDTTGNVVANPAAITSTISGVELGMKYKTGAGDKEAAKVVSARFNWYRKVYAYAKVHTTSVFEDHSIPRAGAIAQVRYQYSWNSNPIILNAEMAQAAELSSFALGLPYVSSSFGNTAITWGTLSKTLTSVGTSEDAQTDDESLPGTWQGGENTAASNIIKRSAIVMARTSAMIRIGNYSDCMAEADAKFNILPRNQQLAQVAQAHGKQPPSSSAYIFEDPA